MQTKLVRTNSVMKDGWALLLICAGYAMAFYIFALTMKSVSLVA